MVGHSSKFETLVVIGGGFAGLTTALSLWSFKPRSLIILIEPRSRFVFNPLLYELLSGELQSWEIAPSYRTLLSGKGIILVDENAENIDFQQKIVSLPSGQAISFDKLVLATGARPDSFEIPGVEKYALKFHQLKDVGILKELICKVNSLSYKKQSLILVGAGSTGVELACKISDLLDEHVEICLIEAGNRVLPNGQSFNQEQIDNALKRRDIKVYLRTRVVEVKEDIVQLETYIENNKELISLNHAGLIWTAGVKPALLNGIPSSCLHNGKILIESTMQVKGIADVFAIGDISLDKENPYLMTAQVAMQQGQLVARNLVSALEGKALESFHFQDRGEMLSLGIGDATITGMGLTLSGPLAYKLRRIAYLAKLPSRSLGVRSAGAWLIPLGKK